MKLGIFFRMVYGLEKAIYHLFYHVKTQGKENIPRDGGFIIASNHRTFADPPLIAATSRCSKFGFVAKEELFRNRLAGWFIRKLGAFPVTRGSGDMSVISTAVEKIKEGRILVIFPEGTRSRTGKLGRGHSGVTLIAARSGADVVPAAIVFEGKKLRFRKKVTVRYGKPIPASEIQLRDIGDKPDLRALKPITAKIMGSIGELLEEGNEENKSS